MEIPIVTKYDVIVAGAGLGGVGAAIAAARTGARTLLVERYAMPGGNATIGLVSILAAPPRFYHGVAREIRDHLIELDGGIDIGYMLVFDPEAFLRVVLELLADAGVEILLYTLVSDVLCVDGRVIGLVIENKSGRQVILGSSLVDSTGDGDLVARAGVPCAFGRSSDRKTRPMTLWFRVGGLDLAELADYVWRHPDDFSKHPQRSVFDLDLGVIRLFGFFSLAQRAIRAGDLAPEFNYLRLEGLTRGEGININTTRVYGLSGIDGRQLSSAELEARRQVVRLISFLRVYVPGFRRAQVIRTAGALGVRETRHPIGMYVMMEDDIVRQRQFRDTIATNVQQGLPGEPMHSPDGREGAVDDARERGTKHELVYTYNVPLRALLPQGIEGLVLAGRAISTDESGDRWTRSMPDCIATGQAAGVAAALAANLGRTPSAVPVAEIQAELRRQGARIEEGALPAPFPVLPSTARSVNKLAGEIVPEAKG
jgi:hypothetical protein